MRIWKFAVQPARKTLPAGLALMGVLAVMSLAAAEAGATKVRRAIVAPTTKTSLKITPLSKTARVPLHWYKTVPCPGNPGKTCYTHTLKTRGNLNLKVRIAFTCPSGRKVMNLYYKQGNKTISVAKNLSTNFVVKTVNMTPWTANDFLNQCRKRFGNPSTSIVPKGNGASLQTTMQRGVNVYGKCSGQKQTYKFEVLKLRTTCDTDFRPAG